jgi:nucleotide-binding universal stress UspA family protein
MIKKIICPTDFSSEANNAAEYAAKLAQVFSAELLFINVQRILPVTAAVSLSEGIGANVRENSLLASKTLKDLSDETNKIFNISTDYEVDVTTKSLEKTICSVPTDNVLIVMGTNGVDTQGQYLFGTNTYHVIKKTKCPMLVIPENVSYGSIRKIVFAWDYSSKIGYSLLKDLATAFNPEFIFLHISKKFTITTQEVFKTLCDEIELNMGGEVTINFEQIYAEYVPEGINKYMVKSEADMLAITFYNRGTIRDIFHGTVAKELSEIAIYPLLVMHA